VDGHVVRELGCLRLQWYNLRRSPPCVVEDGRGSRPAVARPPTGAAGAATPTRTGASPPSPVPWAPAIHFQWRPPHAPTHFE